MTGETFTVLVAEDHPLYLDGVTQLIDSQPQFTVVVSTGEGRAALAELRRLQPDVAVLDLALPDIGGLEIIDAITRERLKTLVVCLSAREDSATIYRALAAGARAFLPKGCSGADILEAVGVVARGGSLIPRAIQGNLTRELRLRHEPTDRPVLSARELEVLQLAAEGMTVSEIAGKLIIGEATVKTHLQHIYEKLEVSDRTAAVAQAFRLGFVR
jgi:two-component system, NarL family, nitrate/nitrite response regulator NarL